MERGRASNGMASTNAGGRGDQVKRLMMAVTIAAAMMAVATAQTMVRYSWISDPAKFVDQRPTTCTVAEGDNNTVAPWNSDACAPARAAFGRGESPPIYVSTPSSGAPSTVTPGPSLSPESSPYHAAPAVTLTTACPELKATVKLESDARDAHVVASFEKERELRRQIALSYFKCADRFAKRVDERGRYAHDKALLLYATALHDSFTSTPDTAAMAQLQQAIDELMTTSLFTDVHGGVLALAKSLPAVPTAAPTAALIDAVACRETNFAELHQDWLKALRTWSPDVDNTNRAGALKSTLLSQINYGVQSGAEKSDAAKLYTLEAPMRRAIDRMRDVQAIETARMATDLLEKIHEVNGYANGFTANGHRGAAAISDRDHLQSSKLAGDAVAERLRQLPYCSK